MEYNPCYDYYELNNETMTKKQRKEIEKRLKEAEDKREHIIDKYVIPLESAINEMREMLDGKQIVRNAWCAECGDSTDPDNGECLNCGHK